MFLTIGTFTCHSLEWISGESGGVKAAAFQNGPSSKVILGVPSPRAEPSFPLWSFTFAVANKHDKPNTP